MPRPRKSVNHQNPSRKRAVGGAALSKRLSTIEKRIGQRNLAKMLGVSPRSIRRYKDGSRKPRKDIRFKIGRIERAAKGLRRTKSIKRKTVRAEKIVREHPEVTYYEKTTSFKYSETDHIDLLNIRLADVEGLLEYLRDEGCDMAFFVLQGTDEKTGKERWYSSEIMLIDDFAENWREELSGLMMQYNLKVKQIDLVGIKHNAPTPQT